MNYSAPHKNPLESATSRDLAAAYSGLPRISHSSTGVSSVLENVRADVQPAKLEKKYILDRHDLHFVGEPGDETATVLDTTVAQTRRNGCVFAFGSRSGHPTLAAILSADGTPAGLARGFLRVLGDQSTFDGSCASLTERLIRLMQQHSVGVIFVHELQARAEQRDGIKARAIKRTAAARNWLSYLRDRTAVLLVQLVEPKNCGHVDSDAQFHRRYDHVTALTSSWGPS